MRTRSRLVLILLLAIGGQLSFALQPFKPGERVVFLGDSITHFGRWWPYIWCAYVEQFPEGFPLFISAGFSGDTATGALCRLDRDVFAKNPDTVCVMLGMNDVRRTTYTAENTSADQQAQKEALELYKTSMDQLVKRVTEKKIRCIVVTPSPYDQTMVNPDARAVNPGCNDGLTIASRIATDIAKKYHCDVVDFHGPMTRTNLEKQAKDPSATIIGLDRVHPQSEGSKIMAELFLSAQGVDAAALDHTGSFSNVWAHVQMEKNLRNILWLEDKVLAPRGIDSQDIEASKTFFREKYQPRGGADRQRVESYFRWRGSENDIFHEVEKIERRMKAGIVDTSE